MGFLRDDDVEGMVMAYYAPVLYMFQRYLVSQEITEEVRTEVNQKLLKHVDYFLSEYKVITEKRDQ
jgi:recombinational DNA repair protein (RecF pathway)